MKILLAPHADDETLFACYTLLREKPLVVLCLPGAPRHGSPEVRRGELAKAMALLGCSWISLAHLPDLEEALARFSPAHVFAPLPEDDGNREHNLVGELAARLWPGDVTFYTTYTSSSRTTLGYPVPAEPEWPELKRRALACYESQAANRGTREHFLRPLDEYLVSWEGHMSEARAA